MSDTTMALQNTKPSQSAMVPNVNMRMVYTTAGAAIYRPVILTPVPQYIDSGSGGGWDRPSTAIDIGQHGTSISAGDSMSQKRGPGRPGKNGPDADKLLDVAPAPPGFRPLIKVSGEGGNDELPSVSSTPQLPPPKVRRPRGRPPGSRNKEKKAYMVCLLHLEQFMLIERVDGRTNSTWVNCSCYLS